jgi:hypothetical protein
LGSGDVAPPFLTSALDGGEWSVSRLGRKESPVPIVLEAGWVPEPVWRVSGREESLALAENRTPAVQPVACRYTRLHELSVSGRND